MLRLLSLVLLATLATATDDTQKLFSRRLAEKEGYQLSESEELVDSFLMVLNHITKGKRDPQNFDGDYLLNFLKENRDVPHLRQLEEIFQPIHDASKTSTHTLGSLMETWGKMAEEIGMDQEGAQRDMMRHEMFETVSDRLESGYSHAGESAFGKKGHLHRNGQL